jgi:hypothetical protein
MDVGLLQRGDVVEPGALPPSVSRTGCPDTARARQIRTRPAARSRSPSAPVEQPGRLRILVPLEKSAPMRNYYLRLVIA